MPLDYSKMSEKERKAYYQELNARSLTLNFGDPAIKAKLEEVARADGRTKNNWVKKYVLPIMVRELDRQYAELKEGKGKAKAKD